MKVGNYETSSRSYVGRFNFRGSQQQQVIEVVDNRDGTLSLFTTALDHAGLTMDQVRPVAVTSGEHLRAWTSPRTWPSSTSVASAAAPASTGGR